MKEKTDKLLTLAMLIIGILCAVFAVVFALNVDTNPQSGMFDIVFWLLVGFIGVSVIAAIFFLFKSLAENGKLGKFFILLAGCAALVVALFFLSKGTDVSAALLEKNNLTETGSKMIGACCYLVYLIVIAATAAIVFVEIANSIKKK
ncbi:MAG: hypothetical protein MJZ67_03245 [Bacteroidales bacterium]|nr:hypothetical protein [Bacteroidales bacterium]